MPLSQAYAMENSIFKYYIFIMSKISISKNQNIGNLLKYGTIQYLQIFKLQILYFFKQTLSGFRTLAI